MHRRADIDHERETAGDVDRRGGIQAIPRWSAVDSHRARPSRLAASFVRGKTGKLDFSAQEGAMALETLAIYLIPFLVIGIAIKLVMRRYSVELADVQKQAGTERRPRKVFLLGGWRAEQ
jgi:hypothetical protein